MSTSFRSRYGVAAVLMGAGFAATYFMWQGGTESFALMVAAAAIACWYAGAIPSLLVTFAGWAAAWFLLMKPRWPLGASSRQEFFSWLVPLLASLVVIWVGWTLRRVGARATQNASSAEQARFTTEALQKVTRELSSAVTSSDVAHTLVARVPRLIGADGAALGLIDGDFLRVVDPDGAPRQTLPPRLRLPLDSTNAPIVVAARTGDPTSVTTREEFELVYPDGARLAPRATGALAVPIRVADHVVGAMGFPFARGVAINADVISLALLAAELGGQALERAGLYEQERQSREALDRIARLAPTFDSESTELVTMRICAEAARTFAADVAEMWLPGDDARFTVVGREPASASLPVGTEVDGEDYPGLAESLARLEPLYIPDSLAIVRGEALELARTFGTRSSLRIPIALAGRAERLLVLQWTRTIGDVSPWNLALARRFADQAGLALEYSERREAQLAAAQNADETRRLLDITAALAAEMEPPAVAQTALTEGLRALGAVAGVVVRRVRARELELVSSIGYSPRIAARLQRFDLDANTPLAQAARTGEIVAIGSREERARRFPELAGYETPHESWLCAPLATGGRIVGGFGLSFAERRLFTDAERDFTFALSRQAAQALERASLLEMEHAARMRAEATASDIAQLHAVATALGRADSAADVTEIVIDQLIGGAKAVAAAVLSRTDEGTFELAGTRGEPDDRVLRVASSDARDSGGPLAQALSSARPVWLPASDEQGVEANTDHASSSQLEAVTLGVVPLLVAGEATAVLVVALAGTTTDEERRLVETVAHQAAQPLERVRLLESERASRLRSERLQELTTALASALTPNDVLDVFVTRAGPAVDAIGIGAGLLDHTLGAPLLNSWREQRLSLPDRWLESDAGSPLRETIADGRAHYYSADTLAQSNPEVGAHLSVMRVGAVAFVPLLAGRRTLGVAALTWHTLGSARARSFVETFAGQCGQALDRALRYETERTIAETLQRSVLPETLPSLEGATVAARYLPGTAAVDVGGDWFDTIPLVDGRLLFVVGDVVGKGVQAASTMAQLRNGMRALTLDSSDVSSVVSKVNRLLDSYTDSPFATLAVLTVDPATYETELLSAGHLPPLLVRRGNPPILLDGAHGLPIGVEPEALYETHRLTLEPGDVVVLYTDGLVERRNRSLDEGFALLLEAAIDAPANPDRLVDKLLAELIGDDVRGDDVALLAVAFDRAPLGEFSMDLPADREALTELRDAFSGWLGRGAIGEVDRRDLVLALWEASANAIEHAQSPSAKVIHIEAALTGDRVRVAVLDSGGWREPEERPDRGLGLRLIQSLMTSLSVQPSEQGTMVVMERALSRERVGEGGAHAVEHRTT